MESVDSNPKMAENKDSDKNESKAVDLDTILIEEIGQFGVYQFRTISLVALVVIFVAWSASEYVFTTGRIPTRCFIPECDTQTPQFDQTWLEYAIPATRSGLDNCQRYASVNVSNTMTCTEASFDVNTILPCEEYVYEHTNTVVYDYNLACDEWRRSLIGSFRTFGTLLVLPITGYISDKWGRRTALTINAFNTAWMGAVRYWADTYIGFLISEVAEATFGSGGFSSAYILVMEITGPKYRVAAGATMNTFFSIGQVLMALIAWAVPDWRYFTLVLYVPQLITVFLYFLMFESVRWYMSKGRYEESEYALKEIARINKKELSEQSLKGLRVSAEKLKEKEELQKRNRASEPWLPVLVFRYKPILMRCLVSPIWWITTTFVYYGMSIESVNMSGNRYINYMAVSAVEIPGYWTAVYLMDKIGRKPVLITAYWVCAACQFGYIFMPSDFYAFSLTVYLIGKYSIAMVMTSVYVYTTELYPTKYRHSLFAFSSMMGRIGSVMAPLTPALAESVREGLPYVLFGSFALLSGVLVFTTPETLGTSLPDSMEDACKMGKKNNQKIAE